MSFDGPCGIISSMCCGTVLDCINHRNLIGYINLGGITTSCYGSILNCINTGSITATHTFAVLIDAAGGIVGKTSIGQYYFFGNINTGIITGPRNVGGIIGRYDYSETQHNQIIDIFSNNINYGLIQGDSYIGGILGRFDHKVTITDCINAGVVKGNSNTDCIIGNDLGTIINCY